LKAVRTVVFWCHLFVGVVAASIVVIMSATGVLLTYQRQMTAWADTRGLDAGAPSPTALRLGADSLLAKVQASTGIAPTSILVRSDANAPVEVQLGREKKVFVSAYTGAVLGEGSPAMRDFFRVVTAWHRTVGATGERRPMGRSITGIANLGFFFIVLSGLFLWWPRTWTRARLRNIALFRRGTAGKARDFNWHNTIGLWSFLPLVAIVGSGVVMSYSWANALVYRVMGEQPPQAQQQAPRAEGAGGARGGRGGNGNGGARAAGPAGGRGEGRAERARGGADAAPVVALTVDSAIALGAATMAEWRGISIQLPSPSAKTLTASLDGGTGGQPQLRGSLVIDRATATVSKWEPFSTQTPGRRLRSILRFAHTGEVLGLTGQTIAGLVSLGSVLLAWTGVALALRRLWSWGRRRGRVSAPVRTPGKPELETAA